MSASSQVFQKPPRAPDVLGELLHSLSQPLTSLRCSLELSLDLSLEVSPEHSIDVVAGKQQESVAVALQHTEKVIGMVQLMREYLDADQSSAKTHTAALAPAIRSVTEEMSSIAMVRGVQLRLVGTCVATVPAPESQLRLALQYLVASMIESQPTGGKVTLLLGEGPAGAVLRVEGERSARELDSSNKKEESASPSSGPSAGPSMKKAIPASVATLRRVRLAIASRVLETAGASLVFGGTGHNDVEHSTVEPTGFVLRIPRRVAVAAPHSI
jgi:hypothetical protein